MNGLLTRIRFFFGSHSIALVIGLSAIVLVGIPLTVYLLQQQQIFQQQAWSTSQSASSSCDNTGHAIITVQFNNTEPAGSDLAMDVVARDNQTGESVDLGSINPGDAKEGTITTSQTVLDSGSVVFQLKWTNGNSGTDQRVANYPAVPVCVQPTETPTPTISLSPSPSPSVTPTGTMTPTLTPTVTVTPTLTLTATPTLTLTPTLTNTPTATPTIAFTPTMTPTGTLTPTAIPTVTDTPTPTNILADTPTPTISTVVLTSTPTPTKPAIPASGPEMYLGFGAFGIVLTVVGGLMFFLL